MRDPRKPSFNPFVCETEEGRRRSLGIAGVVYGAWLAFSFATDRITNVDSFLVASLEAPFLAYITVMAVRIVLR